MKKLLIGFLVLSLVLLSFVSCNSNAVTEQDAVGSVSFEQMQAAAIKSLNASVKHLGKGELYWRYTAEKKDQGGTSGQSTSFDVAGSKAVVTDADGNNWYLGLSMSGKKYTHTFSVGTWEFTLYAFKNNSGQSETNYIYKGSATAVVAASTTTKVTIGVTPVSSGTGNGTVLFSGVQKPDGYGSGSVLKYKVDGGTYSTTAEYTSLTLGDHTAYAAVFDGSTELVSSSIAITVYRGLTTTVSGQVDDLTGGVEFDADMPQTAVVSDRQIATSANSPAVTATAKVSPAEKTEATPTTEAVYETVVTINEGAIANDLTTGDVIKSELTVTSYSTKVASSTFSVIGANDNVTVAAVDCKLMVTKNNGTPTEVKEFKGTTPVTVTTYILKNLENPKIFYNGTVSVTSDTDKPHASTDASKITNGECDIHSEDGTAVGYYPASGKLIFTTTHFSTFQVELNAQAYILETDMAYNTLADAVAAATSGHTVVLLRDVTDGSGVAITKPMYIDFGGHTYTAKTPAVGSSGTEYQVFHIECTGSVTLANGKVNVATGDSVATFKMIVQNYADLTLDDIELDGTNLNFSEEAKRYTVSNNRGNVVITGNTKIKHSTSNGVALDCYYWPSYHPTGVSVKFDSKFTGTVTGKIEFDRENDTEVTKHNLVIDTTNGTFAEAPISIVKDSLLANEFVKSKVNTITLSNDKYQWIEDTDGYYYARVDEAVNVTTGVYYASLSNAITNATTGQTIKMLRDVEYSDVGFSLNGVNLDLNGKKVKVTRGDGIIDRSFDIFGDVIISNGSIETSLFKNSWGAIYANKGSNLTLNDVDVKAYRTSDGAVAYGAAVFGAYGDDPNGNMVINGGTFDSIVTTNGSTRRGSLTIIDGTFNGELYLPANMTYTINGGTFKEQIEFKSGAITINGGSFEGDGNPSYDQTEKEVTGCSVALVSYHDSEWTEPESSYEGYGPIPTLTINGGTFTGKIGLARTETTYTYPTVNDYRTTKTGGETIELGIDPLPEGDEVKISKTGEDEVNTTLAAFRDSVNSGTTYEGYTVTLQKSIDLTGIEWVPIGSGYELYNYDYNQGTDIPVDEYYHYFKGTFDGNGCEITNLNLADPSWLGQRTPSEAEYEDYYLGFFGLISGATIENLTIKNSSMTESNYGPYGVLVAHVTNNSTISSCHLKNCDVTGNSMAGLMVDELYSGSSVSNCTVDADSSLNITSGSYAAGLVSYAYESTVADCVNMASITCPKAGGGIVGNCNQSTIRDCVNYGNITSTGSSDNDSFVGGITAVISSATVTGCTNNGNVVTTGSNSPAGGVVGQSSSSNLSTVEKNINTGSVTGKYAAGTMVTLYGGTAPKYCYNSGAITGAVGSISEGCYSYGICGGPVYGSKNGDSTSCLNAGTVSGGTIKVLSGGTETYCYYYEGATLKKAGGETAEVENALSELNSGLAKAEEFFGNDNGTIKPLSMISND